MDYKENLKIFFIIITILVLGTVSIVKIGTIDLHTIAATIPVLVPADADYKLAVLNALKKMDKSITLQELNEKLTKTVAEPDAPEPEPEAEDDIDV